MSKRWVKEERRRETHPLDVRGVLRRLVPVITEHRSAAVGVRGSETPLPAVEQSVADKSVHTLLLETTGKDGIALHVGTSERGLLGVVLEYAGGGGLESGVDGRDCGDELLRRVDPAAAEGSTLVRVGCRREGDKMNAEW